MGVLTDRRQGIDVPGKNRLPREFRKLWAALSVSLMGSEISVLALPLIAVITLHASPLEMGALVVAGQAPYLVCSLPLGVVADRLPRRRLLIAADIGSALLLVTVPLELSFGGPSFYQLCVVAFGVGTFGILTDVAHAAYVPTLVGRDRLVECNSRLQISHSAADAAGPGLAGVVVQLLSAPLAVLADAASFAVSAVLLRSISSREQPSPAAAARTPLRRSLTDGLRMLLRHRLLRPILATGVTAVLFQNGALAIYVLYAVSDLRLSPMAIGLTFAAGGAGSLPGAMLARWAGQRFGIGPAMIGGWGAGALAGLLVPLAAGPVLFVIATLAAAKALAALTSTVANIHQWSLRQAVTPDHLAGRVTASQRFVIYGVGSAGALLGGALATAIGLRPALFACSLGVLLAPLCSLFSPLRRLREQPADTSDPADELAGAAA
ncbi:MAG: MFS transporter [Micromonosporaceae bacterium]